MFRSLPLVLALMATWSTSTVRLQAQLRTLSAGNADAKWRDLQVKELQRQLSKPDVPPELKRELQSQADWLSLWQTPRELAATPQATSAASQESAEQATGKASAAERVSQATSMRQEPIYDPSALARPHREALFLKKGGPTVSDTTALQGALAEHSGDVGLRQLQMHWLDQPRYRNDYWKEIGEACGRVISLLEAEKPSDEVKLAMAFAHYRRARAHGHALHAASRQDTTVAGVKNLSAAELQVLQDSLAVANQKVAELVGSGQPEFFQLEIYALRRDHWSGQALQLLERYHDRLDRSAYLAERLALLEALGWQAPASQTAAQLQAVPASQRRMLEIQYRALENQ